MSSTSFKQLTNIRKIGVYIGVPGLGDLLFIIPLFRALKQGFPEAQVIFIGKLLKEFVRPVFDSCPYIDGLYDFHLYIPRTVGNLAKFTAGMRREKFDLIVDTQRKGVPTLLLRMSNARYMVSYSMNGRFSDFPVPPSGDRSMRHTSDVSLDLARALGLEVKLELELTVPQKHLDYADEFYAAAGLPDGTPLLGLVPSAGEPTRCWPPEKFAELAAGLNKSHSMRPICFGSAYDSQTINKVISAAGIPVLVEDFTRGNVLDSAALMKRCSVVVGNVSGPLHVADAVGAPCVGIYGPHSPGRFGLLGPRARAVSLGLDCIPCETPDCEHRRCVNGITVEQVRAAVLESAILSS